MRQQRTQPVAAEGIAVKVPERKRELNLLAPQSDESKQGLRAFYRQAKSGVPRRITRKNHSGELFRDGEAPRGFGSSFGNILKFAFELKDMVCHILAESGATHGKRPQEQERGTRSRI
jgi:hypothetical protein